MIYELREYFAMPGRMRDLQARFRDHTLKIIERHGIKVIGFWTPDVSENSYRLIYMVAFEDAGHRERAWAAISADPEFRQVIAESEVDGPLTSGMHNTLLKPTDFSPLQ